MTATDTDGQAALQSLRSFCEDTIAELNSTRGMAACKAHAALSDGQVAVLRYIVAQIEVGQRDRADEEADRTRTRRFAAVIAGAVSGIIFVGSLILDYVWTHIKDWLG